MGTNQKFMVYDQKAVGTHQKIMGTAQQIVENPVCFRISC